MIRRLLQLFRHDPEPRRLVLFSACGALAVVAGFVAVTPQQAESFIARWGYYFLFGVFAAFVIFAHRVARPRRDVWRGWLRAPGWPGIVIVLAADWLNSYE